MSSGTEIKRAQEEFSQLELARQRKETYQDVHLHIDTLYTKLKNLRETVQNENETLNQKLTSLYKLFEQLNKANTPKKKVRQETKDGN